MTLVIQSSLIILVFPQFNNFGDYTPHDFMVAVSVGVLNMTTQILLSLALKYEDATVLAPLHYMEVIVVLFADLVFFGTKFSLTDISGIVIVSVFILIPLIKKCLLREKEIESSIELQESLNQSVRSKLDEYHSCC